MASYLARARSTNEPEASRLRADSLNHFLRTVKAFQLDHGSDTTDTYDKDIKDFRLKLEHMLSTHPTPAMVPAGATGPGSVNPKAELGGDG